MLAVESTIDSLLIEVQKKADAQLELLLDKLLQRVLYPPIAKPSGTCAKHGEIKSLYVEIACLRTKYHKLHLQSIVSSSQVDHIEGRYILAKEAYHSAKCTCIVGIVTAHNECICCGALLEEMNGCRHPIHLMYKKRETVNVKPKSSWIDNGYALSFDSGSGW